MFLKEIGQTNVTPYKCLTGKKIEFQTTIRKGADKVKKKTVSINILSDSVWRMDLKKGANHLVQVQNGSFCFESYKKNSAYVFGIIGFDESTLQKIKFSTEMSCDFIGRSFNMFDRKPENFFSEVPLVIEKREKIVIEDGIEAEKVLCNWTLQKEGKYHHLFGEFIWIPGKEFFLKSHCFWIGRRGDKNAELLYKTVCNYQMKNGVLTPLGATHTIDKLVIETKITKYSDAETDPVFYTPESLGLDSPTNPFWYYVGSSTIGLTLMFVAVVIFRRRSNG